MVVPGRLKRISLLLLAALVLAACLAYVWRAFGVRSVAGAFLFNWLPLCWPPVVRPAYTLRLPAGYYRLRPLERGGRLYRRFGIRAFHALLQLRPLRILNMDIARSFQLRDFVQAEREMRLAESSHAITFLLVLLLALYALARGWWDGALYLVAWNVPVNAYPVMLQRYNRGRLVRLLAVPSRSLRQA